MQFTGNLISLFRNIFGRETLSLELAPVITVVLPFVGVTDETGDPIRDRQTATTAVKLHLCVIIYCNPSPAGCSQDVQDVKNAQKRMPISLMRKAEKKSGRRRRRREGGGIVSIDHMAHLLTSESEILRNYHSSVLCLLYILFC